MRRIAVSTRERLFGWFAYNQFFNDNTRQMAELNDVEPSTSMGYLHCSRNTEY